MQKRVKASSILPYVLVAPLLIWIFVTVVIPVFEVLQESFMSTTYVGTKGEFIGFDNYLSVLKDKEYWTAWIKSVQWIVGCTVIQTVLGFTTALLLNRKTRFASVARVWSVIPWVIPTIVVSIMWMWIFNSSYGILNNVLKSLGIITESVNFFSGGGAMWALIFMNVWHWFPFTAVVLLAGLSTIPDVLYESAQVDGASKFQQFRYITMPSLSSVTFALVVVGTLWCFNVFDIIYITTEGGPLNLTTTVPVYIYRSAFKTFSIGRSSAASIITAVLLFVLAMVLMRVSKPASDE